MDNGVLGHGPANLHRQHVPPHDLGAEEAGYGGFGVETPILYAKTNNVTAAYLYDSAGAAWNPTSATGWARFVKAVPCDSQGAYLPGYTISGPFVYIELPFPVAGSGIPGVRLLAIATVIRYVLSDGLQTYGAYTMDGFCLDFSA